MKRPYGRGIMIRMLQHGPSRFGLYIRSRRKLRGELTTMPVHLGEIDRGELTVFHEDATIDQHGFDAVAARSVNEAIDVIVGRHPLGAINVNDDKISFLALL